MDKAFLDLYSLKKHKNNIAMSSRSLSLILLITTIGLFFLNLLIGENFIYPYDFFSNLFSNSDINLIILNFRLPKALTAVLAGVALSISGMLMQTLFRNPIAGPYVLGISSGASLGVSIVIMGAGFTGIAFISNISLLVGALVGSVGMMLLLLSILRFVKDIMTLLIIGVMLGAFSSSLSSILQYFSPSFQVKAFVLWTFGNLSSVNYSQLWIMFILILLALGFVLYSLKGLNILLLGSDNLSNFGINKKRLQLSVLVSTAILTGVVTAFCGPIGFVGVIVPHFARMLIKTSDHIKLLPVTALLGASVMLVSDILSQLPQNGIILPINSVTAFIGIPFVLWVLLKPSNKIKI